MHKLVLIIWQDAELLRSDVVVTSDGVTSTIVDTETVGWVIKDAANDSIVLASTLIKETPVEFRQLIKIPHRAIKRIITLFNNSENS